MAGENVYFAASWGGVAMLVKSVDTDHGRDVAVQSPSHGDQHVLNDHGDQLNAARFEILFIDQPGQRSYKDRYDTFMALRKQGAQVLSHPIDGTYTARVSDLKVTADADALEIRVSCTFLRETPAQQVFPVEAGTSTFAGLEATSTAVATTNAALAELLDDLESSDAVTEALEVPADALEQVTAWSEADDLDSQTVFLGVATLTKQIDDAIATLELKSDLDRWPAYCEMILLRYAIVRAGAAFTADTRATFDLYVETDTPLIAICAEVYGASLSRDRADRIAKSNRLRTPGLVPRGTTLKMIALEVA